MPVFQFTHWSTNGQHSALMNVKFGTGEQTIAPVCQISRLLAQKCGNTASKTVEIGISPTNFPLGGDSFLQFLHKSNHLYATAGSLCVFSLVTFWGQITKL